MKSKYKINDTKYEIEIEEGEEIIMTLPFGFGTIIKWGENSTELWLDVPDTENIEDASFWEDSTEDGTETSGIIDKLDGSGEVFFIKWDISSIPASQNILTAELILDMVATSNEMVLIWYSDNQTWTEGMIDAMCSDGNVCQQVIDYLIINTANWTGSAVDPEFIDEGIKEAVQIEVDARNTYVTFILYPDPNGDTSDPYSFSTKEIFGMHSSATKFPTLSSSSTKVSASLSIES